MAVKLKAETNLGEVRDLYVRVSHGDVSKDSYSIFTLRGYLLEGNRTGVAFEEVVQLMIDPKLPAWPQVYAEFKISHPYAVDC